MPALDQEAGEFANTQCTDRIYRRKIPGDDQDLQSLGPCRLFFWVSLQTTRLRRHSSLSVFAVIVYSMAANRSIHAPLITNVSLTVNVLGDPCVAAPNPHPRKGGSAYQQLARTLCRRSICT